MKKRYKNKRKIVGKKIRQERRDKNRKLAETKPYSTSRRSMLISNMSWMQAEQISYVAQQYLTSQRGKNIRYVNASAVVRMALDFLLATYNSADKTERIKMLEKLDKRERGKFEMTRERSTKIKTEKINVPTKDDIDRAVKISKEKGFIQEAKQKIRRDGIRVNRPISQNESHKRKLPSSFTKYKDKD